MITVFLERHLGKERILDVLIKLVHQPCGYLGKGKESWRDKAGQKERMRVEYITFPCSMWQCTDVSYGLKGAIETVFHGKVFCPEEKGNPQQWYLLVVDGGKEGENFEFDLDSTSEDVTKRLPERCVVHKAAQKRSITCKAATGAIHSVLLATQCCTEKQQLA